MDYKIDNKIWGTETVIFDDGSTIVKLIESNEDSPLSIQLHPQKQETFTAIQPSRVRYITRQKLESFINSMTLDEFTDWCINDIGYHMNTLMLQPGDPLILDEFTVHQIMGDSKIIEVATGEPITWRLNDLDRGRELHIKEVYTSLRSSDIPGAVTQGRKP